MDIFKQHQRGNIPPIEVHKRYKEVIGMYNKHLEREEFLPAYLIILSLFEERVSICTFLLYWYDLSKTFDEDRKPTTQEIQNYFTKGIGGKIKYIREKNFITNGQKGSSIEVLKNRNNIVHGYIWNYDKITQEDCDKVYKWFRVFDKSSLEIKKSLEFEKYN